MRRSNLFAANGKVLFFSRLCPQRKLLSESSSNSYRTEVTLSQPEVKSPGEVRTKSLGTDSSSFPAPTVKKVRVWADMAKKINVWIISLHHVECRCSLYTSSPRSMIYKYFNNFCSLLKKGRKLEMQKNRWVMPDTSLNSNTVCWSVWNKHVIRWTFCYERARSAKRVPTDIH